MHVGGKDMPPLTLGAKMKAPTEADLYAMAMESETAHEHMEYLCAALGVSFPPQPAPYVPRMMADPIPQHH